MGLGGAHLSTGGPIDYFLVTGPLRVTAPADDQVSHVAPPYRRRCASGAVGGDNLHPVAATD